MSPAKPSAPAAEPIGAAEAAALLGPHLKEGALLAVSGGPDSMALLGLATEAARRCGLPAPQAFTFDHGLRQEAREEAAMVAAACDRLGISHHLRTWPAAERPETGIHAAARLARYAAAILVARQAGLGAIVTAHHRDDLAETVVMRLARTLEARALTGIETRLSQPGFPEIVRPFLRISGARLGASLARLGLPAVQDPSNSDAAYERSRIRAAMPALAAAGIDGGRLAEFAARQRKAACAVEEAADRILADAEVSADGTILLSRPLDRREAVGTAAWSAALRRLLMAAGGRTASAGGARIEALDRRFISSRQEDGGWTRLTLAGAAIDLNADRLVFAREWGRAGPAPTAAERERSVVFDGRHIVAPHTLAGPGTCIAGFGRTGRGGRGERTLPALFAGERLLAVPPCLAEKAPKGCRTDLESTELVGRRLADPHIGGLYDRLIVENRLPATTGERHNSH
ncbi:tRNA lysidine(34) synthetase TilS [Afifella sp. IM 167]|uniref:tRNA lysidine(34) synthetase TilS n=1 Tax=Afifella sp. IM 167 TaxID=2033586 RepID=UPI001CCC47EA|nr:tRNA lysidine(34) synthetase TilS [Afifella sp. IM 167]